MGAVPGLLCARVDMDIGQHRLHSVGSAEAADCPVRSGNDGGAGCGSIGRLVCPEQIAAALFTVAEIHGGYRNDLAAMGIGK